MRPGRQGHHQRRTRAKCRRSFCPGVGQRAASRRSSTIESHARGCAGTLDCLVRSRIGDDRCTGCTKFLNAIVAAVSYEDVSERVRSDILWPRELSISAAEATEGFNERAGVRESLNPVVTRISDIDETQRR